MPPTLSHGTQSRATKPLWLRNFKAPRANAAFPPSESVESEIKVCKTLLIPRDCHDQLMQNAISTECNSSTQMDSTVGLKNTRKTTKAQYFALYFTCEC